MKQQLISALEGAVSELVSEVADDADLSGLPAVNLEVPRNPEHGDFSSNIAMVLAKPLRKAPREIANQLVTVLGKQQFISNIEIAGPGFINFTLTKQAATQILQVIADAGEDYGKSTALNGQKFLIEFVSANPTGPLHVGHGRGAAYGDAIASLLQAIGGDVTREYYVNDAGRQMDILTLSVWIRYLQQHEIDVQLPPNAYQGDYIVEIAEDLASRHALSFVPSNKPNIPNVSQEMRWRRRSMRR